MAKIHAAVHDTTVNKIVRTLLEQALSEDGRARAAADRLLALAKRGPHVTADPGSIDRDE